MKLLAIFLGQIIVKPYKRHLLSLLIIKTHNASQSPKKYTMINIFELGALSNIIRKLFFYYVRWHYKSLPKCHFQYEVHWKALVNYNNVQKNIYIQPFPPQKIQISNLIAQIYSYRINPIKIMSPWWRLIVM